MAALHKCQNINRNNIQTNENRVKHPEFDLFLTKLHFVAQH